MNCKNIALIILLACSLAGMAHETVNLNFDWKFGRGEQPGAETTTFDASAWETVNLPHDFQIHQEWVEPGPDEKPDLDNPMANIKSRLSARGFKEMGSGWYRKTITPDASWKGKRVVLDFEGILLVGDAYLNGERIGGTDYGYLGFECDITDKLKYGEPNVIAVFADTGKPENSRWYTGAGLYRDVNLKISDKDQFFTRHPLFIKTPEVGTDKSLVTVRGEMSNKLRADSITVGISITAPDGSIVYNKKKNHWNNRKQRVREFDLDSVTLTNVKLWDTENPNLYTLEATLYRPDGSIADQVSERFGVRSIEFSPEFGMKLNGKKILLKGIANHHTLGALGAAAYPRALEKRIQLLKEFGFNHIRTSHNPYSESLMDLCDEYGILVVDELYDKWKDEFIGGRKPWTELWQQNVPEWVRRDRNHPSVVFWSFGNELQLIPDMPFNDWGVTPYRLQKELLKRYDDTRLTTVAMHPRGRNESTDSLPAPLALATDIAAYNYRYMYFPGDSRRFPDMMFYQSEANTSNMGPNWFDMDLEKVIGAAYWGMIDYFGESNGWPAKGWTQGVFDISLQPKPNAYFLKSLFQPEQPIVRLAPFTDAQAYMWNDIPMGGRKYFESWNFAPGETVKLYTFTNADEVELRLNGKSLGRKRNDTANSKNRNRILWENIPFKSGNIEALAYMDGQSKPVARHRLATAGKAKQLKATPDNHCWKADGIDLQHVLIEAVDTKGNLNPGASDQLTFELTGPAEIVGVINGDITSDELTVGNSRKLFDGKATVILRSKRDPGNITLKVCSAAFPAKKINLVTK